MATPHRYNTGTVIEHNFSISGKSLLHENIHVHVMLQ